jgi:hypothetical protein
MASTRNKNMKNDYYLEQRENKHILDNRVYIHRKYAFENRLPCAGINVGYRPNDVLSLNATDIESQLYGINSTNLVQEKSPLVARLKKEDSISFFERMQTYIPEPLVVEKNQRPIIP